MQIPAFYLTKASTKFEDATCNGLRGVAFTRKFIILPLTLALGRGQTRDVAQYPLHYMSYAPESLKKLFPTVLEEMHLQDIFDLTLTLVEGNIKIAHLHYMTYVPAQFESVTANG